MSILPLPSLSPLCREELLALASWARLRKRVRIYGQASADFSLRTDNRGLTLVYSSHLSLWVSCGSLSLFSHTFVPPVSSSLPSSNSSFVLFYFSRAHLHMILSPNSLSQLWRGMFCASTVGLIRSVLQKIRRRSARPWRMQKVPITIKSVGWGHDSFRPLQQTATGGNHKSLLSSQEEKVRLSGPFVRHPPRTGTQVITDAFTKVVSQLVGGTGHLSRRASRCPDRPYTTHSPFAVTFEKPACKMSLVECMRCC